MFKRKMQSLGQSLMDVIRAEVQALMDDLHRSAHSLLLVMALAIPAVMLLFWATGVAAAVLITTLAIFMPTWAAALIVFLVLVAIAAVLMYFAWRRLRQVELPTETVLRHVDDHLEWWRSKVADDLPVARRNRRRSVVEESPDEVRLDNEPPPTPAEEVI